MRIPKLLQALSTAAAVAMLAACTAGPAITQKPASPQGGARFLMGRATSVLGPTYALNINTPSRRHFESFNSCPSTGPIEYASDDTYNVINVYAGRFADQGPCGQITSGLLYPAGMYVKTATHDLYVANPGLNDVLVFHRGQTTAYNVYTDPSVQSPLDVTVAKDDTVIASNSAVHDPLHGSISTWIGGPNGGTFVGNFPMTNSIYGYFITVKKSGSVYFNDVDATFQSLLWSVSCPAGACGVQTQIAGVSFVMPGGIAFDSTGDLVALNELGESGTEAETFELPNPNPSSFPLIGWHGMALLDHHMFTTTPRNHVAEYAYPSGKRIGGVPGNYGGSMWGVAVDP